ncbi:hypothetical protein HYH03_006805 [Edaphochlamys debaryana]|uniref:Uncharacterized protein n=1 Tax=Edaphochlamys debaryana TaxID=47281 RepID=A0A835YCW4_9CHLO|nr:hypothetical protein HYH03_006805 [Edaphochlamys debaryana]|eukprot:KAG2495199.1 hypothetical protein HYH03_006805 [Edaphochlamys debaryana]
MQERFRFDVFSAILLFLVALGGAYLPKYLMGHGAHVETSHSLIFHLGNMLSAGVMLSAGFCHLLADAHRFLLFVGRFPMSNFLAATGYIITLLADQVVQYVTEQQAARDSTPTAAGAKPRPLGHANGSYQSLPGSGAELTSLANRAGGGSGSCCPAPGEAAGGQAGERDGVAVAVGVAQRSTLARRGDGAGAHRADADDDEGAANGGCDPELAAAGRERQPLLGGSGSQQRGAAGSGAGGSSTGAGGASGSGAGGGLGPVRTHSAGGTLLVVEDCHTAGVAALLGGGKKLSFATAILLAAALCIHSILEGMALGAQVSMRSTEDIMVAIAAHKGLAAYALGASIVESGASSTRFWTVISAFSLATPIGIFSGFAMSSNANNSKSGAALSALASGTFLYVAFMEVIPKELADGKHRALKMLVFLIGYGLMSMLAIWA